MKCSALKSRRIPKRGCKPKPPKFLCRQLSGSRYSSRKRLLMRLSYTVRACFPLFAKGSQQIAPEPTSVSNCRVTIMEEYGNLSLVARPNVRIVKERGNTE